MLNARYHEQEAYIVAQAGRVGAVTIATNMAGRGTDIQLGGNFDMRVRQELAGIEDPELRQRGIERIRREIDEAREVVRQAGGLYIIGTERHESRRIDNQLRGRSGRQGDPGASKFFLSLEARNFEIRKQLLRFDDVMNEQRKVIYQQRREVMSATDVSEMVLGMREQTVDDLIQRCIPSHAYAEQWDVQGLHTEILRIFNLDLPLADWAKEEGIAEDEIRHRLTDAVNRKMAEKAANYGPELMRYAEKSLLLQILDTTWKEHLLALDHLRQGISLRAYAQRDPLNEYKSEAFVLFEEMLVRLRDAVTMTLARLELRFRGPEQEPEPEAPPRQELVSEPADASGGPGRGERSQRLRPRAVGMAIDAADPSTWGKVARNSPCPCGSGKKYKQCHGKLGAGATAAS